MNDQLSENAFYIENHARLAAAWRTWTESQQRLSNAINSLDFIISKGAEMRRCAMDLIEKNN